MSSTQMTRDQLSLEAARRLAVTRDLLRQARAAETAGDATEASNLARKAETLARDLSR